MTFYTVAGIVVAAAVIPLTFGMVVCGAAVVVMDSVAGTGSDSQKKR